MEGLAAPVGIGTAVLLYIAVNLFLPSGISTFSLSLSNPETMISNLPTIIVVAFICEAIGIVLGIVISKIMDII